MAKEIIHICKGERKRLSSQNNAHDCMFRCITGWGYIRIMSEPKRLLFQTGSDLYAPANEIVTISCIQDMTVEMELG